MEQSQIEQCSDVTQAILSYVGKRDEIVSGDLADMPIIDLDVFLAWQENSTAVDSPAAKIEC